MELDSGQGKAAVVLNPARRARVVSKKSRRVFLPLRLQGQLIIPYVLLTLIIAMIGMYVVTRLVTTSIRERFVNQLYEARRVASDGFVRRERAHLENLRLMAFTEGAAEALLAGNKAELQRLLLPLAFNGEVELITAIDLEGREVISLARDPQTGLYLKSEGKDFNAFPAVRKVLDRQEDELGDKYIDILETQFGPVLVTSAPVETLQGDFAGVLLIGSRFVSLLSDLKSQALADLVVLDSEQRMLSTTLAEPETVRPAIEGSLRAAAGQAVYRPLDVRLYDRDFQIVYAPMLVRNQAAGWMGVVLPSSYLVTTEVTNRNVFAILFTVGTVTVILLGYLLARSIADPILRMRMVSQAVAAGNLKRTLNIRRRDEIGDLAEAMDQMTLRLRVRTAEAQRLYKETAERNAELADINARLQSAQIQLVQSEKLAAVGQLTAGIVHDVKNPLTVIKGLAELLEAEPELKSKQELRMILESAVKANNIVTDLLKFARQTPSEMCLQDLGATVETTLRLASFLIRKARVRLDKRLPDRPILAEYDTQQMEQVLLNLIGNAVQAMPEGGFLGVRLFQRNDCAYVQIEDTGTGIAPEHLNRIFDPFFTTKPEGVGTGLGLSVSYGIVSNHYGQIEVETEQGKGSTFTVILPLRQPEKGGKNGNHKDP